MIENILFLIRNHPPVNNSFCLNFLYYFLINFTLLWSIINDMIPKRKNTK